jgi:aspartate kinase
MSRGARVALVCSARSGNTKATGTTNLLLRAAAEALRPKPQDLSSSVPSLLNSPSSSPSPAAGSGAATPRTPGASLSNSLANLRLFDRLNGEGERQLFDDTVDQIKRDHLEAARKVVVRDMEVLREVEEELEYDCERLRGFLRAAQVRFFFFSLSSLSLPLLPSPLSLLHPPLSPRPTRLSLPLPLCSLSLPPTIPSPSRLSC